MTINWRNLKDLVLPQYLIIIFFTLVSSYMIIFQTLPTMELLLPFLSLSFAMFALNITNNIVDIDLDKINKPLRPLPSKRVTEREATWLARLFIFLSLLLAYPINDISFFALIVFNFLSVFYSIEPIRLKRYILADNVIGSIIYGAIPFIIVWSLSSYSIPIIFLLFFTGMIFAIASIKDFEDMKGEKEHNINTLPLKIGINKTILFTSSIMLILLLIIYVTAMTVSYTHLRAHET